MRSLALPVIDLEQPLPGARLAEPDRAPLAVVEDVRCLVDDEVSERIILGEIGWRDVACRGLAQTGEVKGVGAEQLCAEANQIQVGEVPRRSVVVVLRQMNSMVELVT